MSSLLMKLEVTRLDYHKHHGRCVLCLLEDAKSGMHLWHVCSNAIPCEHCSQLPSGAQCLYCFRINTTDYSLRR